MIVDYEWWSLMMIDLGKLYYFTNLKWGHLEMISLTNHDSSEIAVRSL